MITPPILGSYLDTLTQLENLLLKAAKKENYSEELKYVVDFYHHDFDKCSFPLHVHLELLSAAMETKQNKAKLTTSNLYPLHNPA